MSTLQGSGWQQIKRGLTTIDEVIRYADGMIEEGTADFKCWKDHLGYGGFLNILQSMRKGRLFPVRN